MPHCLTIGISCCILYSKDKPKVMKMIKSISNKLLQYLLQANVIDKSEDVLAYYKYGIEITISSLLNIVLIISIGIISGQLIESILFLICFVPMRQFTGGYHADSYFKCNFLFSVLYILLLIIYNLTASIITFYGELLIAIFSITVIITECPIEHPNKLLSNSQKKNNKYLAIILGLLYSMVGVTLKVLSYNIGAIFIYALMLISILVIVATVQKMRKGEQ